MFYCDTCGEERGWPKDISFRSFGSCEICGEPAECSDIPSKYLPIPKQLGGGIKDIQLGGDDDEERLSSVGFK